MATLVCELCGSTTFVKEGDFLVCESCGLKYTLEDAQRRMADTPEEQAADESRGDTLEDVKKRAFEVAEHTDVANEDARRETDRALIALVDAATSIVKKKVGELRSDGDARIAALPKADRKALSWLSIGVKCDREMYLALEEYAKTVDAMMAEWLARLGYEKGNEAQLDGRSKDAVSYAYKIVKETYMETPFYQDDSDKNAADFCRSITDEKIDAFEPPAKEWRDAFFAAYFEENPEAGTRHQELIEKRDETKAASDDLQKQLKSFKPFKRKNLREEAIEAFKAYDKAQDELNTFERMLIKASA